MVRYICFLCLETKTKRGWVLGPEPPRPGTLYREGHYPLLFPAPEWWPLWQGDTTLDQTPTWDGLCVPFLPAPLSLSGLVPREGAAASPCFYLSVAYMNKLSKKRATS